MFKNITNFLTHHLPDEANQLRSGFMKTKLLYTAALAVISTISFGQQRALNFDGNDDFVSSSYGAITGNGARTIEAHVRTTANCNPSAGGVQKVIVDYGTFQTGQRFTMNLLWSNSIRVEIGGMGVSGTTAVNDGNWHHVAVTYDPSASPNTRLYIDGVLETTGSLTGVNTGTGLGITIGRRIDGVNFFDGDIDEVRVWNTALSANDIQASANDEFCAVPNALKLYYRFNQGTAGGNNAGLTTVIDDGFGNNGTLNNFGLNGSGSNWVNGSSILNSGGVTSYDTLSGCNSVMLPSSGQTVTMSGAYADTLQTSSGCDSIINYQVTITPNDTSVTVMDSVLTAASTADAWQWVDCSNGFTPINGATSSTFTATTNGSYAVIVTSGSCTDTSACKTVSGIGQTEWEPMEFSLYPNPTTDGTFTIDLPNNGTYELKIFTSTGVQVYESQLAGTTKITLNQPEGVYYVEITDEKKRGVRKVVLSR